MTPKTRRVDKNAVKYDLVMGKYPGEIARIWGVSRQYISSIRQELVKERSLQKGKPGRPVKSTLRKEGAKFDWSDMSDIMVALDKVQSMIIKMRLLEKERDQYKKAFEYAVGSLSDLMNVPGEVLEGTLRSAAAGVTFSPWLSQLHNLEYMYPKEAENEAKS